MPKEMTLFPNHATDLQQKHSPTQDMTTKQSKYR